MKGYIYKITNKVNGKSYIGQTRNTVEFRWRQHANSIDHTYFHKAIRKYGKENFEVETLEECDIKDLDSREIYYIDKYKTFFTGYNMTHGSQNPHYNNTNFEKNIITDNKYDEIKGMYLSGYSVNKISVLYDVDRHVISRILKAMGVKTKTNSININKQEFNELVNDYKTGYSLKELSKRYNCTPTGLKEYLQKRGVNLKEKYSILNNKEDQEKMIYDYLYSDKKLKDIQSEYHCGYATFLKILSIHGIEQKGKGCKCKLNEKESLDAIKFFNEGQSVQKIANYFHVDKCTIYSLFKKYHVNYLKV